MKRNTTLVANGGFETPVLGTGAWVYRPAGATWSFIGTSGIAKNNSGVTFANPVAPEGTQVGFVLNTASLWQYINLGAGSYNINLRAAQRGTTNTSYQRLNVKLQGVTLVVTSTKQFVWNGNSVAEERDANNVVTRRFYPQGEQISGASYYYMRDHLGSVRELTDSTGLVRARYDYNAFGYRTKLSGDLDAQLGFTGFYYHTRSGLNLALYRAYDFLTGRWLSRDPIAENGGINLYGYVRNNPIVAMDPLGLWDINLLPPSDPYHDAGDRTPLSPDILTVGGHGGPSSMLDSNRNQLSPDALAKLIKCNPKYNPTKPVRLEVCQSGHQLSPGAVPYGQQLANVLGSEVLAPTGNVIINNQGDTWLRWGYYQHFTPQK